MTTNSQLSTTKPNQPTNKEKTKETTRTGTESQKWRSHGELPVGEWEGERRGKVQRISSINGRWKIDMGRIRIVLEMKKPKNLHV